ncbi:MAG: CDP-alcohol phosphatidyltransferase family protein [Gammaproteobacteria bacterium]
MKIRRELLTVPNLLTGFRFFCAPILLTLAWQGHSTTFLLLLAMAFLSDALDGMAARLSGQVTQFGAILDSWADMVTYLTITLGAWWLWPDIVRREALYAGIIVASYVLPVAIGLFKFGALTSYHTWTVKLAAASIGLTYYVLFLGGPSWPFRIAALVCVIAAFEEIAITLVSTELHSNVGSLFNVLRRSTRRV